MRGVIGSVRSADSLNTTDLIVIAAAPLLLATPVNCLCGADLPTPRALIGLSAVLDAAEGEHGASHSHHHGSFKHDHPYDSDLLQGERHHHPELASESSVSWNPHIPTVQELTPLGERVGAVSAVLATDMVSWTGRPQIGASGPGVWTSRIELPDVPPPRAGSTSA